MYGACGVDVHLPVGISLPFAVDKHAVEALPAPGGCVVAVEHKIAAPRGARAVGEKHVARAKGVEFRIGHVALVRSGHRLEVAQLKRARGFGAGVAEWMAVVVERSVEPPFAVHTYGGYIVGVGHVTAILCALRGPRSVGTPAGAERAFGQHKPPLGIVIGCILRVAVAYHRSRPEYGGVDRCGAPSRADFARTYPGSGGIQCRHGHEGYDD